MIRKHVKEYRDYYRSIKDILAASTWLRPFADARYRNQYLHRIDCVEMRQAMNQPKSVHGRNLLYGPVRPGQVLDPQC